MGSDAIARPALDWLAGEGSGVAQVVGVFTQPDRASGRGQQVQPNAIKRWAQARRLPVHQPERMDADALAQLAALRPDVTLVMAYGRLLRQAFIDTPRLGTLNLHTSLLPKYRGASPIQTAVSCGERETGVTLMRMVLALDAGPVGDLERVSVAPLDTAADVEDKLARACPPLLARALPRLAAGSLKFTPQDEAQVTFCRRLAKADGGLDFAAPAAALAVRINGLFPWPGCQTELNGQPVKLGLADAVEAAAEPAGACSLLDCKPAAADGVEPDGKCHVLYDTSAPPGTVVGTDADGLLVATGRGLLRLRRLQRPGGKMLPAADFLRGFPVAAGTVLASHPMPPLAGPEPFPRAKG
ncbi:MAG: methionyl-tRNA formyltransferase [Opitutae bacterium]|nr:methionyl-tRNA formyltransferase [Opitutae bacterium]